MPRAHVSHLRIQLAPPRRLLRRAQRLHLHLPRRLDVDGHASRLQPSSWGVAMSSVPNCAKPDSWKRILARAELAKSRRDAGLAVPPDANARAPEATIGAHPGIDFAQVSLTAVLPHWPEEVRAVPNGILRSALFGVVQRGRRRYLHGVAIAALDGVAIRYKGERLDQCDLTVWQSVLHAVRHQRIGSHCKVASYTLLKLMGKTDSGKNRATLQACIERLVATALTVQQGRHTYIGSLIASAAKDESTRSWTIELDPRLSPLFCRDQFTQLEWAVRRELRGHQLAEWLHGFYATHAKPFGFRVETLRRLCGSEAEIRRFRQSLGLALAAVAEASKAHGEKFRYTISEDLVEVSKAGTASQQRHLARRAAKSPSRRSA